MAKKEFKREHSRLVNLECYMPYLTDAPEDVPISLPPNNNGPFVHQHIYFQESKYRQDGVELEKKDMNLVWMRRISYNQIIMRRHIEPKLHRDHEDHVIPPPPETNRQCLEDFEHVDNIGAAILGKVMALKPDAHPDLLDKFGYPARYKFLSPTDRADFFDEQYAISLEAIKSPQITPERVISSALKRMSIFLEDSELEAEADRRINGDKTHYPLRMPKLSQLYQRSNVMIARAFELEEAA